MDDFIDTSVVVAAIVTSEPYHLESRPLVFGGHCQFYAHGIAETFNTLTGGRKRFRLSASEVAVLLDVHVVPALKIVTLTVAEMLQAMREAESRGVRGGAIFDYLHLMAARKARASRLYTLDMSNFLAFRRAGDPEIVHP